MCRDRADSRTVLYGGTGRRAPSHHFASIPSLVQHLLLCRANERRPFDPAFSVPVDAPSHLQTCLRAAIPERGQGLGFADTFPSYARSTLFSFPLSIRSLVTLFEPQLSFTSFLQVCIHDGGAASTPMFPTLPIIDSRAIPTNYSHAFSLPPVSAV